MNPLIVIFDGECNLCSSIVNFIKKHTYEIQFEQMQSQSGIHLMHHFGCSAGNFNSLVLLKNNMILVKSKAVLHIVRELDGLWPLLYVFNIIPQFILDKIYDKIADNRYKWFGKTKNCQLPSSTTK
jgi:predicted DCC family thiol-disulfide oxidoreductase YuxK